MAALAVPAPSIIQIGCISVKKAGFFAFFLRFYFLFLLQGKKPFPLRASTSAGEKPQQKGKDADPQAGQEEKVLLRLSHSNDPFLP